MRNPTIGIVGFGRFGKVIHRLFEGGFKVLVSSSRVSSGVVDNVVYDTLETVVSSSDAVFLTVPINRTEETTRRIKPFLRAGQVVVDVCSVKETPNNAMKSVLADVDVTIWPTHPMFGPDSTKEGFGGLVWVSCEDDLEPDSIAPYTTYIEKMGLNVVKISCAEHDRMAARTQGLTHFIGRFLDELRIAPTPIDTVGYKRLMAVRDQTCNDTWELFCDLQYFNRFSGEIHQQLLNAVFSVLSRFLDTIPRRIRPVIGILGDEGRAQSLLSRVPVDEATTDYQFRPFDTAEDVLKHLFVGDIDLGLFKSTKNGMLDIETLNAMGTYSFNVEALVQDEQGESFVFVKRRSWSQ